jgi:hypothetical protein
MLDEIVVLVLVLAHVEQIALGLLFASDAPEVVNHRSPAPSPLMKMGKISRSLALLVCKSTTEQLYTTKR